ncbi:MAG: GNAT family N-acetyltransferase [bacterium]|nr:GNAT family N-acetyltransferase [bacterium]
MNITQLQKNNTQIKDFEKKEWQFADNEHYGENHKYFRKTYKFVAQDNNKNILGFIELVIEPNIAFIEGLLVDHELKRQGIGKKTIRIC